MWHFIIFTLKNDKYTKEEKLVGYRLNSCYFKEMNSLTLPLYLCTSALSEFFFFYKVCAAFRFRRKWKYFFFWIFDCLIYIYVSYICVYIYITHTHTYCVKWASITYHSTSCTVWRCHNLFKHFSILDV